MKIAPVIFSRMSSTRLPGKALISIQGRPLLSYVIERAKRINDVGPVILATSVSSSDDVIERFARNNNLDCFRGDLNDVLRRALDCAERYELDGIIRICGDRPFFDPGIVGVLLKKFVANKLDLATNVQQKTFPAGMTAEVISTSSLRVVSRLAKDDACREHVTKYYYRHPDEFRIYNLLWKNPDDSGLSMVVDTNTDLVRTEWIASVLKDQVDAAPIEEIIRLTNCWNSKN